MTGLLDILTAAADQSPEQVIVHVDGDGGEHTQTYRELLDDALGVAGGLRAASIALGTPVIVLPGGSADFLVSFWGAIAAGLVPVPMAAVPDKAYAVWSHLGHPPVIADDSAAPSLFAATPGGPQVLNVTDLRASPPLKEVHRPDPTDCAFLQFSSGSTGTPKGVKLSHANVLINIEQARATGAVNEDDVIATWLPYFHDMGLIGAHLTPLSAQIKQVKLDPVDFGKRPALWYEAAQRHGATLLPMAGFALAMTLRRLPREQVAALDLSTVRLVGVGAEPISVPMWRDFIAHMAPSGLAASALAPLYGLAEATVAVAFPPPNELARPLALDRRALADGRAVDVPPVGVGAGPHDDLGPAEFMDVGFAVPGGELRIVNDDGTPMPDSVIGEVQFRGPNVADGYHRRPHESAETFVDGWLRTGDLGFMRSGRLCVTGRIKDVLFVNGQKFHAHDIEQIVASTPGAPSGRVAVVGWSDVETGAERVAVFVSSRGAPLAELRPALVAVRARVREALAHPDVGVYPIAPVDFPRTTSGKIQRGALRKLIVGGVFTALAQEVASIYRRDEVETIITDIWSRVLGVPGATIGIEDRFLAIGGSSLTAMQVLEELEIAFERRLSPAVLSRCATVAELADHLLDASATHPEAPARAWAKPSQPSREPTGIIGLACRFPDADSPEAFWDNLLEGRDSVTAVPISRWPVTDGPRSRWGAFLGDVSRFDADFFGISNDNAAVMDPHARIFLEVAHEALERAGYAGARRNGRRVGVFVAIGESHYPELIRDAITCGFSPSAAQLTGNLRNLVAARVSHHLDLTGPAMVVDTACSSALVALHIARRSMESGECDLAVVGGVHLNLTDTAYTLLEAAQALSPTGRCHTFSVDADGFVPGEGAAALVLEPLTAAVAAGDTVLAVVRGSATNNDGRSLSLMAPNPLQQETVITEAYADAAVDPATVSYIEAHGTGTAVGDPIEARSLMRTFPATEERRWLGSVKTNVGHLLNAAGMPSLLKVVLSLQHRQLPPSLHYGEPSPLFDLPAAGFAVVTEPQAWNAPSPLRAGINGFGFGGTNAHVILEEASAPPAPSASTNTGAGPHLLTLSAVSDEALRTVVRDLAAYVREHPGLEEGDVCRSASTARDDARHRLALVINGDLAQTLEDAATRSTVGAIAGRPPPVTPHTPGGDGADPSTQFDAKTRSLAAVGNSWMHGASIARPDAGSTRPRVPVPTYPFQRTQHWLPAIPQRSSTIPASVSPLLHRFDWSEAPLPAGSRLTSVCIVGPDDDLAEAVTRRLIRRGVEIQRAQGGDLLGCPPTSAVLFVPGSPDPGYRGDPSSPQAVAPEALSLTLDVCRQLSERPTPLIVVTCDVAVTGTVIERPRPAQAVLAGLAMALPQECAQQGVRVVDLSSLDAEAEAIDALIRELDARPEPGPAQSVAWRKGRRLAVTPMLTEVMARDRSAVPLPADGRYLITGGAGGIGSAVASVLAAHGHPDLILVGRSLEAPNALLNKLSQLGANARYVSADLALDADVDALVRGLPALDGVFHAAGVATLGSLRSVDSGDVTAVLAPKVTGTLLLARALDRYGRRPDTFVLFSSISSVLPGFAGGLGSYAAANAFLDAFASSETAAGRPVQSLNLAAVADTGMASGPLFAAAAATSGMPTLRCERAVEAILEAATLAEPRLVVIDATARTQASQPAPPPTPSPAASSDESMRDLLTRLIAPEIDQWPQEIDDDASLLTMGLDSLTAVDLVKTLEHELGTSLPTTLLFEYPSIAQLSAYLAAKRPISAPALPEAAQEDDDFALTPVQTAFQALGRLHPGVAAYACIRLTVDGDLDETMLARALAVLDERHEMLRMRITTVDGEARQRIEPPTSAARPAWFKVSELSGPVEGAEEGLANEVFSLDTHPPIRAALVRDTPDRVHLIIVLHHAGGDGASLNIVCEELWTIYTALVLGQEPDLLPVRSHFRDYVRLAERARASDAFAADLAYWQGRLQFSSAAQRARPSLLRPPSPPSSIHPSPEKVVIPATSELLKARQLMLSRDVTQALRQRAAQMDVSLFHLVLSIYVKQLSDLTGLGQVTVNVARSGRDARLDHINRIVGSFADTLPLTVRVNSTASDDPAALPFAVRQAWLDTMKHAEVSTLDLARMLPALDDSPRTAGDASFSFARFPLEVAPQCPVQVSATAARTASAATRLGLVGWEFDGCLHFSWNYPSSAFATTAIDRLAEQFCADLTSLVDSPPPVSESTSIVGRIHRQCVRRPDAIAVQVGDQTITYAQLDRAARMLAHALGVAGVAPRDRVGLLTEPGAGSVIGILGILYAGATWVPLDPRHPVPRLVDQVSRCRTTAVVTDANTLALGRHLGVGSIIDVNAVESEDDESSAPLSAPQPEPGEDAYIIFTSGTSGRPKGIPITHHAITTYLDWAISTFDYAEGDRMAATASVCFDASVRQVLAPLLVGATIVVIDRETLRDPAALLAHIEQRRVTVWSSVPTLWAELLRAAERRHTQTGVRPDLSALRWIHTGGEVLLPALVRRWFDLFGVGHRIVNLYGPTEATINATFEIIDDRPDDGVGAMPIGRAVAKTVIEVVDPDGRVCGPGEVGELWLSGPGITAGYLDDPALTAQSFVVRNDRRYYRSGDRGLRRADGKFGYVGRIDRQVTLSGHRIEPAEIEAVLNAHAGVEHAAVVVEAQPGSLGSGVPRLVAYVQWRPSSDVSGRGSAGDLRAYLATRLPPYMVPAQIRFVEAMPLTVVGKVDFAHLDAAVNGISRGTGRPGQALTTPTQHLIARAWRHVIGVDHVFADDDFFALGGDSIGVLEVFAQLERDCPALPAPTTLYRHRVLADLASVIDAAAASSPDPANPTVSDDLPFPLTPAQRGFLVSEALATQAQSSWVNSLRIDGPLDAALLRKAVDALVARHLMLRVQIAADQRPPVQREVSGSAHLGVSVEDVVPERLASRVAEEHDFRFNTSDWPLVRLRLLRLAADQFVLLVHGHHAIADGYSVALLIQELMVLYDGLVAEQPAELPALRSTFRDYVALVQAPVVPPPSSAAGACTGVSAYTAPRLRRSPTVGDGPDIVAADPYREGVDGRLAAGMASSFTLDGESVAALGRLAATEGTTAFAPLAAAYYRGLARVTHQSDLVMGVVSTGREYSLADVARIVGPCAHLLPIRVSNPGTTLGDQALYIGEAVIAARESRASAQHVPIALPVGASAAVLGAQFVFSYLDFGAVGQISSHTLKVTWDRNGGHLEPPPIGTDLFFSVQPSEHGLRCNLRSSAGVMTHREVDELAESIRRDLLIAAGALSTLDAAIVGYLPAPVDLMVTLGQGASADSREGIRRRIFPDGQPRLLEEVSSRLGTSGFVVLPLFADELAPRGHEKLSRDVASAVRLAVEHGARCVSLAGMLPAHTAYGMGVVRELDIGSASVSTGHAATVVSVVKTVVAALDQTGRDLAECAVAFVGLGSIGRSALDLLLALSDAPKALVLCDVSSRRSHLEDLASQLAARGHPGKVTVACSGTTLPAAVYGADVIVAAVSGGQRSLDVNRLRPGAIVVDDSFPHCFDEEAVRHRMTTCGDILVVGGGLLDCGPVVRRLADGILPVAQMTAAMSHRLPDTIASCQLESLLQAHQPQCPAVHGLVSPALAATYWNELTSVGIQAAPLHLLQEAVKPAYIEAFRRFGAGPG